MNGGHSAIIMETGNTLNLMVIYGIGYILIYLLFFFMYAHALAKKVELELTKSEIFDTKSSLYAKIFLILIGVLAIVMANILPQKYTSWSGIMYALIGPVFTIFYTYRGRKKEKLLALVGYRKQQSENMQLEPLICKHFIWPDKPSCFSLAASVFSLGVSITHVNNLLANWFVKQEPSHWGLQKKLQVFYKIPVAPANGNRYSINLNHFGCV